MNARADFPASPVFRAFIDGQAAGAVKTAPAVVSFSPRERNAIQAAQTHLETIGAALANLEKIAAAVPSIAIDARRVRGVGVSLSMLWHTAYCAAADRGELL